MKYLLEFSDEQKAFHLNGWNAGREKWDYKQNSNGFMTISEGTEERLREFIRSVEAKHEREDITVSMLKLLWIQFNNQN